MNLGISRVLTVRNQTGGQVRFKLTNPNNGTHNGSISGNGETMVNSSVFAQTVELTYNGVTITVPYPADGILTVTEAMFTA